MSKQELAQSRPVDGLEVQLKEIVLSVLRLELRPEAIDDETSLYDLGLESLNVVELLTEAETIFDITVDVEDLSEELFARFDNLKRFVQEKIDESH
jgi:acyl carrier protein